MAECAEKIFQILKKIDAIEWLKRSEEKGKSFVMVKKGGMWVPILCGWGQLRVRRDWAEQEFRTMCDSCVDTMGNYVRGLGREKEGLPTGGKHKDREVGRCIICEKAFLEKLDGVLEVPGGVKYEDVMWVMLGAEVVDEVSMGSGVLLKRTVELLGRKCEIVNPTSELSAVYIEKRLRAGKKQKAYR